MTTTREREPEPFKPTRSTTKIVQPRKGYSEQILPDSFCSLVEVFCLPDQSIFISNGYKFSTWNIQDKTFTKVKKEEPRYGSTYKIIKVGNSNSLFVYEDTYTCPERDWNIRVTSLLFEGEHQICELPSGIYHPICLADKTILGFTKPEYSEHISLKSCIPTSGITKTILKFDKNKEINGFYALRNNHFLILDKTGLLCLYQLRGEQAILINQKEAVTNITTIQDLDDDHFVSASFHKLSNENNKIKDGKTKLQLWKKDSLTSIQEFEIIGVLIEELKQLPNLGNRTSIIIGVSYDSIFIINFEKKQVHHISIGHRISNFNITDNGKVVVLYKSHNDIIHLIQIEPEILVELINQPGEGIIQTHIDVVKQPPASLQPYMSIAARQPRQGYSEKTFPQVFPTNESHHLSNVFLMPNQSVYVTNTYKFFVLSMIEPMTEINISDLNDLFKNNPLCNITKVGNSDYHLIYDYFIQDPEDNNFEKLTSVLFEGRNKVCVMPTKLYYPIRLTDEIFLGIDESNRLLKCFTGGGYRVIFQLDINKKITGFYGLNINYTHYGYSENSFAHLDETGLLSLYQLWFKDNEFSKTSEKTQVKNIKAIEYIDSSYFASSTFDNFDNANTPLKDCVSRIHLWKKNSLSCVHEFELYGYKVEKLKRLPDSNTHTGVLIGSDNSNIFIIDFEKNKITIIDMDCICLGFNIDVKENLIILKTDRENINYIVQIEFDLVEELINLPSNQRINRLHIDDLRYTTTSLQPINTEEKLTNSEEKAIGSPRSTFFYTPTKKTVEVAASQQHRGNTEDPSTLAVARGILASHI